MIKTPAQAALVQLIESLIITALIAALIAIAPILNASGPIDWRLALGAFGLAFVFSLAHGLSAYLKAYNPQLATVVDADVSALEHKVPAPLQGSQEAKTNG